MGLCCPARAVNFAALLLAGQIYALPGEAAEADCADLRAQLASLDRGATSPSPEYRNWNDAAERQAKALTAAEREAFYLNCDADATPACANLFAKIERMRTSLSRLEARRDHYSGASSRGSAQRALISEQMQQAGCIPAKSPGSQSLNLEKPREALSSISESGGSTSNRNRFAVSSRDTASETTRSHTQYTESEAVDYEASEYEDGLVSARFGNGAYRTLCVRTCDGFYFPVSFSTQKYGFARDEAICRSMCPAAETTLYVHRNPGETIKNLVSMEGAPYSKLPNAFLFRTKFVENCSCQSAPGERQTISSLIRSGDDSAGHSSISDTAVSDLLTTRLQDTFAAPTVEIPDGADPDTEMNIRLGYTPDQARPSFPTLGRAAKSEEEATAIAPTPAVTPEKREIRIVGPKYFVAQ